MALVDDLRNAGVPMPHTELFSPDSSPDETRFGPYMAIKTTAPCTVRAMMRPPAKNLHLNGIHKQAPWPFAALTDTSSWSNF